VLDAVSIADDHPIRRAEFVVSARLHDFRAHALVTEFANVSPGLESAAKGE
jgi:hypothetical protein